MTTAPRDFGPRLHATVLVPRRPKSLAALGDRYPLPLLPIAERVLVHHQLDLLVRQGFRDVDVVASEGLGPLREFLDNGRRWGIRVRLMSATGGARDVLSSLAGAPSAPSQAPLTLLWPGDLLAVVDLRGACAEHLQSQRDATLVRLEGDAQQALAPRLLSPEGYRSLLDGVRCGRPPEPPEEHADPPVATTRAMRVDSAAAFLDANAAALSGALFAHTVGIDESVAGLHVPVPRRGDHHLGFGAHIGKNRLDGTSLIGDEAVLADGVKVKDSVIGAGSVVDGGVELSDSVVLPGCYVGRELTLAEVIAAPGLLISRAGVVTKVEPLLVGSSPLEETKRRLRDVVIGSFLFALGTPLAAVAAVASWRAKGRIFEEEQCLIRTGLSGGRGSVRIRRFAIEWPIARDLPALLDVVAGRLALVGNPPISEDEAQALDEPWQQVRFDVPAGVFSLRELEPDGAQDATQQLIVDATYAAQRSRALDRRILFGAMAKRLRHPFRGHESLGRCSR